MSVDVKNLTNAEAVVASRLSISKDYRKDEDEPETWKLEVNITAYSEELLRRVATAVHKQLFIEGANRSTKRVGLTNASLPPDTSDAKEEASDEF